MPELICATHIIPWGKSKDLHLNPTKRLCLSATFDRGLFISLDDDYHLLLGAKIESFLPTIPPLAPEPPFPRVTGLFFGQITLPPQSSVETWVCRADGPTLIGATDPEKERPSS